MTVPGPEREQEMRIEELESRLYGIETAATKLFVVIWKQIQAGFIPDRGPIADNALVLRDALNPNWPQDSDWLPEELR
jgi:hypothetical protein